MNTNKKGCPKTNAFCAAAWSVSIYLNTRTMAQLHAGSQPLGDLYMYAFTKCPHIC